jgi:hypothetical protein
MHGRNEHETTACCMLHADFSDYSSNLNIGDMFFGNDGVGTGYMTLDPVKQNSSYTPL